MDFKPQGALQPIVTPTSFEFNGMTNIEKTLLFPDGCIEFLPDPEMQIGVYFDTYGCVSFSYNNALETDIMRRIDLKLYKDDNIKFLKENFMVDGKLNFSDRDLVVLSGTDPKLGNSGWQVFLTAHDKGLVCETDAPWDFKNRDPKVNTKENYYAYTRSAEADKKAQELLKRFEVKSEWVNREDWLEASKYGVLQVYTNAWYSRNGKFYNPVPNSSGHAIELAQKSTEKIFDQYEPFIKQLERDEDFYPLGLKISLIEKNMIKPIIKNNTLVQLVTAPGGFGLYLDGRIIVDDLDKILASWLVRNNGNTVGKTMPMQADIWNLFDKVNLKMEKL